MIPDSEINYVALQDYVYEHRRTDDHTVHGLDHWNQVEYNGLLLAKRTHADVTIIRLFALLHDSCRENDKYDPEHGPRGAELAKALRGQFFDLDDERFGWLYHACQNHTRETASGIVAIDTCYDADRLDLGRVGLPLDASKMATEYGKHIARISAGVPVFKMREWIRSL